MSDPSDDVDEQLPQLEEIASAQGWDDTSLFLLAKQFIDDNNLLVEFIEYLEDQADAENAPDE